VQQHVIVNALSQVGLNITLPVARQPGGCRLGCSVGAADGKWHSRNDNPQSTYNALPIAMNGGPKNPIGFLSLVPGMSVDPIFGTPVMNGGFQETSQIYVNGLPLASSELQGGSQNLGLTSTEMIDQFQVLTSGIPANYDGQGITNLVLKSGTNRIHGSVYEIFGIRHSMPRLFHQGPTPVEHQNEYGFTIGGPVLHDRIFTLALTMASKSQLDPALNL